MQTSRMKIVPLSWAALLVLITMAPSKFSNAATPEVLPMYTNPTIGMRINLPDINCKDGDEITPAILSSTVEGVYVGNVRVCVKMVALKREECIKQVLAAIASQNQKVRSTELTKVNGYDAFRIDSDGEVDGRHINFISLYVMRNTDTVVCTCAASDDTYKLASSRFEAILKSVSVASTLDLKAGEAKYVNPKYALSIAPPEISLKDDSIAMVALFDVSADGATAGNINIQVTAKAMKRDECLQKVLSGVAAKNLILDSRELREVDGHDAFLVEFHGHDEGMDVHFLTLYIPDGPRVITVTCTAPEEKYKLVSRQFRESLDSVKLVK